MEKNQNALILWIIGGIILSITGQLAFKNLQEWYVITVLNNTAAYPFGEEGPTPYYYETKELYALVSLVWGLLFSGAFALTVATIIKKNNKIMYAAIGSTVFLLLALFIHGQVA